MYQFEKGFTLLELIVSLSLMVGLALLVSSLGGTWIQSANVTRAQGVLQRAYSMTKNTALANSVAKSSIEAAAILCFSSSELKVFSGESCNGGVLIWKSALPSGVEITLGGITPSCLALTNTGALVSTTNAGDCVTSVNYSITAGLANVTNKILY